MSSASITNHKLRQEETYFQQPKAAQDSVTTEERLKKIVQFIFGASCSAVTGIICAIYINRDHERTNEKRIYAANQKIQSLCANIDPHVIDPACNDPSLEPKLIAPIGMVEAAVFGVTYFISHTLTQPIFEKILPGKNIQYQSKEFRNLEFKERFKIAGKEGLKVVVKVGTNMSLGYAIYRLLYVELCSSTSLFSR